MRFTSSSLNSSGAVWHNQGTLGRDMDISDITGSLTTDEAGVTALCFAAASNITLIDYDTNSAVRPSLTMEV